MAKLNTAKRHSLRTEEGAPAKHINAEMQLRRTVMACLLWENQFYENGESVADRIETLCFHPSITPAILSAIAIEARQKHNLRHVPLLVAACMAKRFGGKVTGDTIYEIIQRPDELCEFLAVYWRKGKCSLSAQVKIGLARAFRKFDEYQLAKYNRDSEIKLRDVLFLCHAKPKDEAQAALWKRLVNGELQTPDTWEVALSGGADKRETFERLMRENKLGALAFLRNLRNMAQVGIGKTDIKNYADRMKVDRILPFQFIAAAKYAPSYEDCIENAMIRGASSMEKLDGETAILVDHSGSMREKLSDKSEITRFDAAAAVAILLRNICTNLRVFTFSDRCVEVPCRHGFALRDSIMSVINPVGTQLGSAVRMVLACYPQVKRLIVITDEQSSDRAPDPHGYTGYVINVSTAKNGIGYGPWVHIDGFSEHVVRWIREFEAAPKEVREG